ncbi:MAG: PAS domain S-box protein [Candidatus Marinimicrobia bacterium]|nr:PAS domain S-box protein [Candidatus Neomarinimicrobiota bacterium]
MSTNGYRKHEVPQKYLDKWQKTVDMATEVFEVPAALIMRVHPEQIEVLVANHNKENPYKPHELAKLGTGLYCETVMATRNQLQVPNALVDPLWKDNPDIKLGMIHYLGVPLIWPDDSVFGTICILDRETRYYVSVYWKFLWQLKEIIEGDFKIITYSKDLEKTKVDLEDQVKIRTAELQNANEQLELDIIERKRAEMRLRLQSTALEATANTIIITDKDGIIQSVNPAFTELTGYTAEEAIGQNPRILQSGKHDAGFYKQMWDTILKGQVWRSEIINQRKDGQLSTEEMTITPIRETGGEITHFIAIKQNITERKRLEDLLRESEEKYRLLAESSPEMIYLIDTTGYISYVNKTAAEQFNVPPEELIGKHLKDIYPPDIAQRNFAGIQHVIETRNSIQHEVLQKFPTGDVWVEARLSPVIDKNNQVIGILGLSSDITFRKLTEGALRDSEEQFRLLFENSQIGIGVSDLHGNLLAFNDAMMIPGNYTRDDIIRIGNVAEFYYDLKQRDVVLSLFRNKRFVKNYHVQFKRKDGTPYDALLSLSHTTFKGKPCVQSLVEDITERVQADEALKKFANRLNEAQRISHIGSWELDIVNDVLTWSDEIYRIFEIDPKKFGASYDAFLDAIHPDDREAVDFAYANSLKTQTPFSIDHRLCFADGRIKYVHEQCETIYDSDGKPLRSMGVIKDITTRTEGEKALIKSEEKFRQLFMDLPDAIFLSHMGGDNAGDIIDVNPTAEKQTGYTHEELIGKNIIKNLTVTEDKPYLLSQRENDLLKGNSILFTEKKRRKNGYEYWAEVLITPFEYENKQVALSVNRDVTVQKQAEEALKKEHDLAQKYLDIADVMLTALNAKGEIVMINNKGCSILEYKNAPELIGKNWFKTCLPKLIRDEITDVFNSLMAGKVGMVEYYENLVLTSTGTERIIAFHNTILHNAESQIIGILFSGEDITERKHAENTIQHQYEVMQGINIILEAALKSDTEEILGMICLDVAEKLTDSKFGFIGEIGEDGLLHDIALSDPGWELCKISDPTGPRRPPGNFRIHGIYGRVLTDGKSLFTNDPDSHTDSIGLPLGHPPLTAFLGVPLIRDHKTIGMIALGNREGGYSQEQIDALEPLTPVIVESFLRQRAESELRNHREHLEELVADRTHELRVINNELEAFSYSVSHDLRAPLRGIDGFSNILMEEYWDKFDDEGKDYLERISKSTEFMGELIDDLLSLARVTRTEMKFSQTDLSKLSNKIIEEFRILEPARKMEVVITPEMVVHADSNLMEIALRNLIGNAWKFTKNRTHPKIEIGVKEKGQKKVFYIKDNGVGFDMKYVEKLFTPFQRLHSSGEFEGTGVGLANVKRVVDRHGGNIWAESKVDKGATFYFSFDKKVKII